MKKTQSVFSYALYLLCVIVLIASYTEGTRPAQTETPQVSTADTSQTEAPYSRNVFFANHETEMQAGFPEYYQKPVHFTDLPLPPYKSIAVVGSTKALFYPGAKLTGGKDLPKLKKPVPVPQGAILPIFSEVKNSENPDGLFFHDDCYNYFYETEYEGKRGLVFGADLFGPGKTASEVVRAAQLYAGTESKDALYPYSGLQKLPASITGMIEDLGIAYTKTDYREYLNDEASGSVLLALYEAKARKIEHGTDTTSLFLSSDLITDTFFTLYSSTKENLWAAIMLPTLNKFVNDSLLLFKKQNPKQDAIKKINTRVVNFFLVAEALNALLTEYKPEFDTYDNREILRAIKKSSENTLASYPQEVRNDVVHILDAQEDWHSAILDRYVDYTLFTDTTVTGTQEPGIYQKMLTWLSLPFAELQTDSNTHDTKYYENAAWILYMLAGIGDDVQLSMRLNEVRDMEAVFSYTMETGYAKELAAFLRAEKLVPMSSWITDNKKIENVLRTISKKAPRLLGGKSFSSNTSHGLVLIEKKESTINALLKNLSRPQIENREQVSGLDLAASIIDIGVFGSNLYEQFPSLQKAHATNRGLVAGNTVPSPASGNQQATSAAGSLTESDSISMLSALYTESQATEQQPAYAKSPGWFAKKILSGLGMIALSEPTEVLELPLPSATAPGTSVSQLTFRLNRFPNQDHWLEPAVAYYKTLQKLIADISAFQKKHYPTETGLLADTRRKAFDKAQVVYTEYLALLERLVAISQKEEQGLSLTIEENLSILRLPATLARLLSELPSLADYTGLADAVVVEENGASGASLASPSVTKKIGVYLPSFRMVYRHKTDAGLSELYCAPGLPLTLYIPVQTPNGNWRIAAGYMYSYAEFTQTVGVFTAEEWKRIILSQEAASYGFLWE